jgi:hypothetical protein
MKQRYCIVIILLLTGCIVGPSQNETTQEIIEVRSGVYMTNNTSALPLPIRGYDLYVIGEEHGIHEIKTLFVDYLRKLHQEMGLQHVVLEESQCGEERIQEYVLGISDTPWPNESHEELLGAIRELNETLSENEKIHVHSVDIYPHLSLIYDYLKTLQEEIRVPEESKLPPLEEFEEWDREAMLNLIDDFIESTDSSSIVNKLETAKASVKVYFADTVQSQIAIREETVAQNILYLLQNVNSPVLALYGDWHAKKSSSTETHPYTNSWANRLAGHVRICSLYVTGIKGERLSPISYTVVPFHGDLDQVVFPDGTTLQTMLDENPDYNIVYIDLLLRTGGTISITSDRSMYVLFDQNSQVQMGFDGIVVFRNVTPAPILKNEDEYFNFH